MKPEDIKVGKKYQKLRGLGLSYIYLGVGKRVMWEGKFTAQDANFTDKHLVVISPGDQFGMIVQDPIDCIDGHWEGIVELKD